MYSQNNEEQIILEYFKNYLTGTFLDCGCNDGVTLSNTRALFEKGWTGTLIDASPKAFERLCKNYEGVPGINLFHLAISNHDGSILLNDSGALISKDDISLVSTVHEHEMDRFKSVVQYDKVEVPCITWNSFIELSAYKEFDFISLDVEGCEMDVLPYLNLSQTKMICIEWNGKPELQIEYEKYLSGFNLIHVNGENLIYAR